MNQLSRRAWTGLLLTACFSAASLLGCSGGGQSAQGEAQGQMRLPLTTQGSSGATYRLRDATFVVQSQYYGGTGGSSSSGAKSSSAGKPSAAGAPGGPGNPGSVYVSSETDPNATNISLSLEEGYYNVQLLDGWRMEKSSSSGTETVEATLLTGASQWVYVSRQYTSWAEFSFGIGAREIWLNGQLNIAIDVQETPGGTGGAGGAGGAGGGFAGAPGGGVAGAFFGGAGALPTAGSSGR